MLGTASGKEQSQREYWVSAWTAGLHEPVVFPWSRPAPEEFHNQTLRMVVRVSLGGKRLRISLGNTFAKDALRIGAVHVALSAHDSKIIAGTDHALTFGGNSGATVPVGAPELSDPVDLEVSSGDELAVSLYVPNNATASTLHALAQHATYIAGPGDLTAAMDLPKAIVKGAWYWLSAVEIAVPSPSPGSVVAFGDSITDGAGAAPGKYADWPDQLALRLANATKRKSLAVVNEGIGGNRILHDGAGVNALARFDRDVLSLSGVQSCIILEGINDIGWPTISSPDRYDAASGEHPFSGQKVTAAEIIAGLMQMAERAHIHRIKVFGGTLTPFEGSSFYTARGEEVREQVNQWIRTSPVFDGVIDFDLAVRDPKRPESLCESYQSGDHLHPSAAGYKAMADAVNLALLTAGRADHRPTGR